MTEADVEIIFQLAKERFPKEKPSVISDNGPKFIAKDFKEFIKTGEMAQESQERMYQTLMPPAFEYARRIVYVLWRATKTNAFTAP